MHFAFLTIYLRAFFKSASKMQVLNLCFNLRGRFADHGVTNQSSFDYHSFLVVTPSVPQVCTTQLLV